MTQKHDNVYKSKKRLFIDNFVGGIGWAVGATIGASIIVALIAVIMKHINLIPIVGTFVLEVQKFIQENSH